MATYVHCLLKLQAEGVTDVFNSKGEELPIECEIEHALVWSGEKHTSDFEIVDDMIVRNLPVVRARVARKAVA